MSQLTPDQVAQIHATVDALPPLTPDQQDRLAEVLVQVDLQRARENR